MAGSQTSGKNSLVTGDKLAKLKSISTSSLVETISSTLGSDAMLHLVGGTVRDILNGEEASDIDLASKVDAKDALVTLEAAGLRVIPTGVDHGTITIVTDEEKVELTTFRVPGPRESAKPAYSDTIEEDLSGRDFTINAIAFNTSTDELVDPFDGVADLNNSILRAVNDAETRILEDPLRILRMIRFGPAAARTVERSLADAAKKQVSLLTRISPERIRVELEGILLTDHTRQAFEVMRELEILPEVLPEVVPTYDFEQNDYHPEDVFYHTLTVLERAPEDLMVRLAALFHDLGKPPTLTVGDDGRRHFYNHEKISADLTKQAMKRLRFSNELTRAVQTLVALHMRPVTCGGPGIRRLMRDLDGLMEPWLALKHADAPPLIPEEQFKEEMAAFKRMLQEELDRQAGPSYGKLAVSGDDLKELGLAEGRRLGTVLNSLEEIVIEDPDQNERHILMEHASRLIQETTDAE